MKRMKRKVSSQIRFFSPRRSWNIIKWAVMSVSSEVTKQSLVHRIPFSLLKKKLSIPLTYLNNLTRCHLNCLCLIVQFQQSLRPNQTWRCRSYHLYCLVSLRLQSFPTLQILHNVQWSFASVWRCTKIDWTYIARTVSNRYNDTMKYNIFSTFWYKREEDISNYNQQTDYNPTTRKIFCWVNGTHNLRDWGRNAYVAAGWVGRKQRKYDWDKRDKLMTWVIEYT